jgi:TRAP-type C4-dicarboxylate transport system permease large subunit
LSDLAVGRIQGGLAHINVVSSMLMGGVSGSSTADVAGIGAILIPTMKEKGYSSGFSASLMAASSSIGSIMPPSILMVIYGASANVSIGALFITGDIPGILVGLQQWVIARYYAGKYHILIIMALVFGKITPPYGISLLLACTIAGIPLSKGLGWTFVFFGAFCTLILAIIFFPGNTLWLPSIIAPDLVGR